MTIGSFRCVDVAEIYRDMGWSVYPLLVVRDVRYSFASLLEKFYGTNGTTAEDPPLRMRMRRFHEDWQLFKKQNWPILSYERFVEDPINVLNQIVEKEMGLPWDDAMVDWPKSEAEISYMSPGNETCHNAMALANNLISALDPSISTTMPKGIPFSELEWLEETFDDYNKACGYPKHILVDTQPSEMLNSPSFEVTRRNLLYNKLKQNSIDINIISKEKNMISRQNNINILKLNRVKNHCVFGPSLRLWQALINKKFEI